MLWFQLLALRDEQVVPIISITEDHVPRASRKLSLNKFRAVPENKPCRETC